MHGSAAPLRMQRVSVPPISFGWRSAAVPPVSVASPPLPLRISQPRYAPYPPMAFCGGREERGERSVRFVAPIPRNPR